MFAFSGFVEDVLMLKLLFCRTEAMLSKPFHILKENLSLKSTNKRRVIGELNLDVETKKEMNIRNSNLLLLIIR